MSEIKTIKEAEEGHQSRILEEQEKSKERINRAKADASFRVNKTHKEREHIITDIISSSMGDIEKEVSFLKEENSDKNKKILDNESKNIEKGVAKIVENILT